MVSKVDICNYALQELGADTITSLNEKTTSANECKLRYESCRRSLLQMHLWNFAIKRVALNKDASTPAFNYGNEFTLPADFLYSVMTGLEEQFQSGTSQVVNSNLYVHDVPSYGGVDKYRIEGKKLLSYDDNVNLVYVADIEDTQQFSATFVELLARWIAVKIAFRLTGSRGERDTQLQIFERELAEYQSIDSQQGVFNRLEVSGFLSEYF
ncbi:MAG: hypothetical protein MI745_14060 [Pseudomonadales bacterium]|nr:hypothetical protein [Pseudomonadales bacterium]